MFSLLYSNLPSFQPLSWRIASATEEQLVEQNDIITITIVKETRTTVTLTQLTFHDCRIVGMHYAVDYHISYFGKYTVATQESYFLMVEINIPNCNSVIRCQGLKCTHGSIWLAGWWVLSITSSVSSAWCQSEFHEFNLS